MREQPAVHAALLPLLAAAALAGVALACSDGRGAPGACHQGLDEPAFEACLRAEIGAPADASRVVIFGQSSHLDWDWLRTFDDYFRQSVEQIFTDVLEQLPAGGDAAGDWVYSIAEVGYVERFVAEHPGAAERLREAGRSFRILGGGITSPDNLLPESEAFIRNYLVGRRWTDSRGLQATAQAWLPDDFGHDAQLPIVLRAMGLDAVGFARVPGIDTLVQALRLRPPTPGSLADRLLQSGVDFVWRAADGSEVMGHWLARGYGGEADDLDRPLPEAPDLPEGESAQIRLRAILDQLLPASHTPYAFVPVGSDFERPKRNLVAYLATWNETSYPRTGVFLVAGSFDDYARLVALYRDRLPAGRFDPTPYWTGHIATRPEIKVLHAAATRALLAAESLGLIASGAHRDDTAARADRAQERRRALARAWEALVPSTHHDFVNGTSTDQVTLNEQLPLLREALALAEAERDRAADEIAAAVAAPDGAAADAIVVLNPLGFARRGLVESPSSAPQIGVDGQRTADGSTLHLVEAPSLGYTTISPATASMDAAGLVPASEPVTVEMSPDGGRIVLTNAALRAEIRRSAAWGLVSFTDRASGEEMIAAGAVANDIVLYHDQGGLYRFGNEMAGCSLTPNPRFASTAAIAEEPLVIEAGPLRAVVETRVQHEGQEIVRRYELVADEPFLRLEALGAAPRETSVMVHFPLAGNLDEIVHGTPAHWDAKAVERGWYGLTFEAVHNFAIARSAAIARGAVLRAGASAWAATRGGLLLGVLWRNATFEQCDAYGPEGTDFEPHLVRYALRVASGIGPPESGVALRESLAFASPLLTRRPAGNGNLPRSFSLASVRPLPAILTAAKPAEDAAGGIALRLYQPSNAPLAVHVESAAPLLVADDARLTPRVVTALETAAPPADERRADLRGDGAAFDLVADRALTTISIAPVPPASEASSDATETDQRLWQ